MTRRRPQARAGGQQPEQPDTTITTRGATPTTTPDRALRPQPAFFRTLLTELGLVQLRTVGQSGDRGIDVEGHLRVSSVISFRVGVQCKLYADGNKVTPRQIRELQGALGPFDRGIFMTTSVFTQQAEEQASSPGYKPIDLIDGERLLELLQEHQLGVAQVTVVDHSFFAPFKSG
jgi:restriction system protein